jgi:hypothetical protein
LLAVGGNAVDGLGMNEEEGEAEQVLRTAGGRDGRGQGSDSGFVAAGYHVDAGVDAAEDGCSPFECDFAGYFRRSSS